MKTRQGWIRSVRKSKALTFLAVTDGQEEFQVTIKHSDCEVSLGLSAGASIQMQGEDGRTPRGDYEFKATSIEVLGESGEDYPVQPKFHSSSFLRTIPQTRGRDRRMCAIMHARSETALHYTRLCMRSQYLNITHRL